MAYRDHTQGHAFCYEVPRFRMASESQRDALYYQHEIDHLNSTQKKIAFNFPHPDDAVRKTREEEE